MNLLAKVEELRKAENEMWEAHNAYYFTGFRIQIGSWKWTSNNSLQYRKALAKYEEAKLSLRWNIQKMARK